MWGRQDKFTISDPFGFAQDKFTIEDLAMATKACAVKGAKVQEFKRSKGG
jgi:hypothetical protein